MLRSRCSIGTSCSTSSRGGKRACDHDQPYICVTSEDGRWGSSPASVPGALGNEGVCSVGFWEGTLVLFLGRWYREWEEKAPRSMEFQLCSLHVSPSNDPNLCIYVLYMSYII
jgi:hypothetical protein